MMRCSVWLSPEADSFSSFIESKFCAPERLASFAKALKEQGKTIATLNGSFDLLHAGHLEMIYQASRQADVLIVALNSDRSIQQYKSPKRPLIPLRQRMEMVGALAMVDYVTFFEELDPRALLSLIQPHVHVNGAEYGKDCIEAETVKSYGGRVHIVDLVPGLSTSALIQKVLTVCA